MDDDPIIIGGDDRPQPKGFWRGNGEWHALFEPAQPEPKQIEAPKPEQKTVEICRSFSYKLNLANHGGPQYESADFFCSRKLTCFEDDQEAVSQLLFEDCVTEVRSSTAMFIETMKRRLKEQQAADDERRTARASRPATHPTSKDMVRS